MSEFDSEKTYILQVLKEDRSIVGNVIVPGSSIEAEIEFYKNQVADYKKIIIYDADSKEAVSIIKK